MKRASILLIFLSLHLYGEIIEFVEKKYIDALDFTVRKEGYLEFDKSYTKLTYIKENLTITYKDNTILIKKDTQEESFKAWEQLELNSYFLVVNAIYYNKNEDLKKDFEVVKEDTITLLIPKNILSNVIEKIEYKKESNRLKYLDIYFTNSDRISIVEKK